MKRNPHQMINGENWDRNDTFKYFKEFDDPTFNVSVNVKISKLLELSKTSNRSFSIYPLYVSLKVVNYLTPFKWRIENDNVKEYQTINGGTTILFEDKTFGFCYFDFIENFNDFYVITRDILDSAVKNKSFLPKDKKSNLVHFSSLPWFSFTSFKHPNTSESDQSIPKIVFGKYFKYIATIN